MCVCTLSQFAYIHILGASSPEKLLCSYGHYLHSQNIYTVADNGLLLGAEIDYPIVCAYI